jgi:hypothetical protein
MTRQRELPGTAAAIAVHLQRKTDAPLLAPQPQRPCEIGLFSDDAKQLDLVRLAKAGRKS